MPSLTGWGFPCPLKSGVSDHELERDGSSYSHCGSSVAEPALYKGSGGSFESETGTVWEPEHCSCAKLKYTKIPLHSLTHAALLFPPVIGWTNYYNGFIH